MVRHIQLGFMLSSSWKEGGKKYNEINSTSRISLYIPGSFLVTIASTQKRKKRHCYRFPQHEVGTSSLHWAAANVGTEQTKGRRAEGGVKGQKEKREKRWELHVLGWRTFQVIPLHNLLHSPEQHNAISVTQHHIACSVHIYTHSHIHNKTVTHVLKVPSI